ncbi:MAG: DUF1559 domain-containing protein [Planctomycetes bacterium]|nr:DUF1559 domain-containing protein [Planctomycetota bacterium]
MREAAARMKCANQVKQIALALHNYHDQSGYFPPQYGWAGKTTGSGTFGPILFHILPFIEQGALFQQTRYAGATGDPGGYMSPYTKYSGTYDIRGSGIEGTQLRAYQCPTDPSFESMTARWGWGPSSYATNYQLFGSVGTAPATSAQNGVPAWEGKARIQASIPDGTSNTLMVLDKMAQCNPNIGASALKPGRSSRRSPPGAPARATATSPAPRTRGSPTPPWPTAACGRCPPRSTPTRGGRSAPRPTATCPAATGEPPPAVSPA